MLNRNYDDPDFFSDSNLEAIAEPADPMDWAPGPNESPADAGPSAQGMTPIIVDDEEQPQSAPAAPDASLEAMAEKIAAMALEKIQQQLGGSDA